MIDFNKLLIHLTCLALFPCCYPCFFQESNETLIILGLFSMGTMTFSFLSYFIATIIDEVYLNNSIAIIITLFLFISYLIIIFFVTSKYKELYLNMYEGKENNFEFIRNCNQKDFRNDFLETTLNKNNDLNEIHDSD